jgi:hypothetical protein
MQVGDKLPLYTQVADYNNATFCKAFVSDVTGAPLPGSPVILTAVDSSGFYGNTTLTMPNSPWVKVCYKFYQDGTYTSLSNSEGGTDETIYLITVGGFPVSVNIVGVIDGPTEGCCPAPSFPVQDTITQNSDRTLTVRLINPDGSPFDLTGSTNVEFRFRNADSTILVLSLGSPVQIISTLGGQLLCILTAAQTGLLFAASPAPFTIIVTQPIGTTVVNLPTQLAIVEQDV